MAIVGGGITGITAAYLLARASKSVILVDKGRIAMSETGHTTAHIIEATDADHRDLIKEHGEENARLNTAAIRSAIAQIGSLVESLGIDFGFKAVDGYLYTEDEEDREYLQRQQEHLRQTGIETEWVDDVPLPFDTIGGVRYRNQYVFHIRRYLLALAEAAVRAGVVICENSLVTEVENGEKGLCVVKTAEGNLRAEHVLLATHVPINDRGTIWAKMYETRTYVAAAPIEPGRVPDALFWDTMYPYHYTRLLETGDGLFLIVGGEDRDVGKESNDESRYAALEEYCRTRFGVTSFSHRWSGQINEPADALPFIGESSVLENVVTKATVFPKRMLEKATHRDVEAASVAEVGEGEGKIVATGGAKYAVARIDGELRAVDPTCTHMGCTVAWNAAEKSWDCPCHGSRFDTLGQVLNSPATSPLARRGLPGE